MTMMSDEIYSIEESSITQNDLNSLYTSIKSTIETYMESNNQSLTAKKEKLYSISKIVTTIISSDEPISLEKINSIINSLHKEIQLLKEQEERHQKEIALFKNCLNKNMLDRYNRSEDSTLRKIKRKLKTKENDYQLKELSYLLCINDQSKKIQELQVDNEQYNENEIKQSRLFPYLVRTNTDFKSPKTQTQNQNNKTNNVSRNRSSKRLITFGNSTNYSIKNNKAIGMTEENEDCLIRNENGFLSERTNRDNIKRIMKKHFDLNEEKRNKAFEAYQLYPKNNKNITHVKNHKLNNNLVQITNMINHHYKYGYLRNYNPLFKKPSTTYYGSFK